MMSSWCSSAISPSLATPFSAASTLWAQRPVVVTGTRLSSEVVPIWSRSSRRRPALRCSNPRQWRCSGCRFTLARPQPSNEERTSAGAVWVGVGPGSWDDPVVIEP